MIIKYSLIKYLSQERLKNLVLFYCVNILLNYCTCSVYFFLKNEFITSLSFYTNYYTLSFLSVMSKKANVVLFIRSLQSY